MNFMKNKKNYKRKSERTIYVILYDTFKVNIKDHFI